MKEIEWFISRYIRPETAQTFCKRLHKLETELTTDQKKKLSYELKRRYNWMNFTFSQTDGITYITANNEESRWAEGEIHTTPAGFKYISK